MKFRTNKTPDPLDELIATVLSEMNEHGVDSPEYPDQLSYLERLHELKAKNRPERLKRDTLVTVAGNLMGILLIVAYEQHHVMTSKGMSFIRPNGPK